MIVKILYTSISERRHKSLEKKYLREVDFFFNDWNKIEKYVKWQDKQLTILGRLLLLDGLSFFGYETKSLTINYTKYGKPFIKNNPLFFNISHSDEIVVCAISDENIGIDIEKINLIEIENFRSIISRDQYNSITFSNNKIHSFYNYWTRHESLIKIVGRNLNVDEFKMDENNASYNGEAFHFKQLYMIKDYACTVCAMRKIKSLEIISLGSI